MSMKNSNDTIGNRIRDLPASNAVPQGFGSYWDQISLGHRISLLKFLVVYFGFHHDSTSDAVFYFLCTVSGPVGTGAKKLAPHRDSIPVPSSP
jgi:hypothetical protein